MGNTVEFGQAVEGSGKHLDRQSGPQSSRSRFSSRTSGRKWAIHATCAAVGTYLRSSYHCAADGRWLFRCHGGI
ncbi:hypothetical protein PspLS_02754 [Pyricularia sp. CBS 133598]|nr:hypothetical protein PspLS_02754 [Pyricularia sp. CBS 133598]